MRSVATQLTESRPFVCPFSCKHPSTTKQSQLLLWQKWGGIPSSTAPHNLLTVHPITLTETHQENAHLHTSSLHRWFSCQCDQCTCKRHMIFFAELLSVMWISWSFDASEQTISHVEDADWMGLMTLWLGGKVLSRRFPKDSPPCSLIWLMTLRGLFALFFLSP